MSSKARASVKALAVKRLARFLSQQRKISAFLLSCLPVRNWGQKPVRGDGLWLEMVRGLRLEKDVRAQRRFQLSPKHHFTMDLCLNEYTSLGYYMKTEDDELLRILLKSKGRLFIDIGGNVGFYALAASRYFQEVWSFETDPYNADQFQENIRLSEITNLKLLRMGLAEQEGALQLWRNPQNKGGNTMLDIQGENLESVHVTVKRFDKVIPPEIWSKVDLIKIDVEGFEENVLQGMTAFFESHHRPDLFVEAPSANRLLEIQKFVPTDYQACHTDSRQPLDLNAKWKWNDVLFLAGETPA